MSKRHGRAIVCACGAQVPVNRQNIKRKNQPGGFKCDRCVKREAYEERKKRKQGESYIAGGRSR